MGKTALLLAIASMFPTVIYPDLNKDLNEFFNSFGASANVSSADIYQGQKAGYGTGGGLTVKNRVLNSKVATVNMPKIDAGCGGIDIYAGGFSFISSEKLVENLKSIAASSMGYAFLLGVETVSPQIANQMKTLQSWANTINGMSINSCETAAQLVGSVWPKNEIASQHICRSIGSQQGSHMNYLQSRHQCSSNEKRLEMQKTSKEKYPSLLYGDYNLAWKAIQQQPLLGNQPDLAELFMTITGTVLVKEGEQNPKIYPSKITNEAFLRVLLEGGTGEIYKCSNQKQCLTISEEKLTISLENSWMGKVQKILLSIQEKILADEELSAPELAFLTTSSLPLYKIVNVLTAYKHGVCPIDLINIADTVAMDMLMQCIKEGIEVIRAGCNQLKAQQMYSDQIDEYITNLDRVRKEIQYYETRAKQKMDAELAIMQKIQMLEEQIALELNL
jgi:conjugative transfer pilus assembly protein TraH